jgi:asparagine synthase (glutamine-hydrolysing)
LELPPLERYARWVSPFHEDDPREIYGPLLRSAAESGSAVAYLAEHLSDGGAELEETVGALDARTYLPEDVLTKVDRASMAHGLEVRSPLVDHRLFEAVGRLGAAEKLGPRRQGKWLLRQLAGELVPEEILMRRKMGFGVPVSAWLAGPQAEWMRERLAEGPLAASGLVARETMGRYVAEHAARQADHGPRLYSLLILDEFLRRNG